MRTSSVTWTSQDPTRSLHALQSVALRDALAKRQPVDSRQYVRAAAKATAGAWQIAVGADLALPEVRGRRTLVDRLVSRYVGRAQAVAAHDDAIAAAFVRVAALVEPPPTLMRPDRLFRVLRPRRRRPASIASIPVGGVRGLTAAFDWQLWTPDYL